MSRFSRRGFLAGSAALAACGRTTPLAATPDKPNVLVILLDQLRASALSAYGDPNIRTPAMDALLSEGIRVEHAIAQRPSPETSDMSAPMPADARPVSS